MNYPGDWTEGLSRLFGEREAIVDLRTQERISYRALAGRVAATAGALAGLGVSKGDRVAILAKNRVEHIDLLFACARLGAIFLPLNWRLTEPELRYMIEDAEPSVLVFDAVFGARAHALAKSETRDVQSHLFDLDASGGPQAWAPRVRHAATLPPPPQAAVSLEDSWIILYTSGTTGNPKGAQLPYRQVVFNAFNTATALDLTSADRTITYTPLFHTGGLHVLTTPMLARGGCVVLADGFEPATFLETNVSERCTLLFGVPTTFEMMAQTAAFESADLSHLRLALCGGAPCPRSLIDRFLARGIVFKQGYGLTEVGPNVLNLNPEDVARKAGSAGRPNLTISVRVVDDDGQVVRGPGRGELCLGGPCVCTGYWKKPDATRAAFFEDGYFRTGDVVEVDSEGFMTIVDRKKDMFISGGENVYPAEVEKVLSDHPAVQAAAVIGIADARWGEVGRAFMEIRAHATVDAQQLVAFAKSRLAGYKVPKEVVFVRELPRNPSGKVQKHLLPKGALSDGLGGTAHLTVTAVHAMAPGPTAAPNGARA